MSGIRNGTWVLVADGEKALIFENQGDAGYPDLRVRTIRAQDNPPDREQKANRPGRKPDVGAGHRSAMEEVDFHQQAKMQFADDLAAMLYSAAHDGEFDRIVLVGAPEVLGEMRTKLHQEVTDRVVGEIPKVLTNHPVDEIEKIVTKALAA